MKAFLFCMSQTCWDDLNRWIHTVTSLWTHLLVVYCERSKSTLLTETFAFSFKKNVFRKVQYSVHFVHTIGSFEHTKRKFLHVWNKSMLHMGKFIWVMMSHISDFIDAGWLAELITNHKARECNSFYSARSSFPNISFSIGTFKKSLLVEEILNQLVNRENEWDFSLLDILMLCI